MKVNPIELLLNFIHLWVSRCLSVFIVGDRLRGISQCFIPSIYYRYAPYYAYGCAGLVWFCFWLWLAFESPAKHPSISPREQYYIEQSIGSAKTDSLPTIFNTPWGKVFTSMPVWAIIVANFARYFVEMKTSY